MPLFLQRHSLSPIRMNGAHAMGYPHNFGLKPSRCKRLPVRGSRGEVQMSICFRRRQFITALGGAAQQATSAIPIIMAGFCGPLGP